MVIDLADDDLAAGLAAARAWIGASLDGGVLNVAGPRASKHPSVYDRAQAFLRALLGRREG
jgi:hypothetical protein